MQRVQRGRKVGELKKWRDQDWVRIGTDGKIKGKCGTSKDKKIEATKAKRTPPKANAQGVVARGCGKVLANRRKRTRGSVS
jgi:hypothetical protein